MGMPAELPFYTVEMVRAIPDDRNRYETVYGELLVTPSPILGHQRIALRLVATLLPYVTRWGVGELLFAPLDLVHGSASLVQPDVFVLRSGANPSGWGLLRDVLLAIEIASPSSRRADRFTKRRLYQEAGVPAYWMVDVDAGSVEVWTPADEFPRVEREWVEWWPQGVGEGLVVSVSQLIAPA